MKNIELSFPTDLSKDGAIRGFYDYITYECSSTNAGDCSHIFNDKTENDPSSFWQSDVDENAYFRVTFKEGYLIPSDCALLSCINRDCIYNISIYGKEKGSSKMKEICVFEGSETSFQKNLNSFACNSSKPLKTVEIRQRGPNDSNVYALTIYHFDVYGKVLLEMYSEHSQKLLRCYEIHSILYFLFILC